MKRLLVIALSLLVFASPAVAQEDWREELSSEQVVTHDGKWVSDDYGIFTFELPGYERAVRQVE